MRSDRIFARILLVISVANAALAAPAAVRQRYLEVVKAASKKRGPGSDGGETSDLPPKSSSPVSSHDLPADKLKQWDWLLWPESPKSSPKSSDIPPDDTPKDKWAWLYHGQDSGSAGPLPESSSAAEKSSTAEDHITTQASGASGAGSGATGDLHSRPPPNVGSNPPSSPESTHASEGAMSVTSESTTNSRVPGVYAGDLPVRWWPQWLLQHSGSTSESESAATGEAHRFFSESFKHELLATGGMIGLIGGLAAISYGTSKLVNKLTKQPCVSPLSPLLRTSSRVTNILTCDLPQ